MATIVAQNSALRAFELARQKTSYSSYAAAVAAQHHDSDSDTASSIGCDEVSVSPVKPTPLASVATTPVVAPRPAITHEQLVNLFAQAMTFMPIKDINVAREATPLLAEAAACAAPQPLDRTDVTFVRWEPTEVPHPIKLPVYRRPTLPGAPTNFSWRCLQCNHVTYGPRCCTVCRAPINGASCRVFLGQLRKDLTAEVTSFMLRSVAPEVNILHVESHTNPNDGRGRGCAWVYVDTVADAMRIVDLHKRIFVDVDSDGFEGFWFVEDPTLVPALSRMADTLGNIRARPSILPRQPMVAELPAKSIIAEIVRDFEAQQF